MYTTLDILETRISQAMAQVTGRKDCAAIVKPAAEARFGDYQANGVMALAKQVKANPRKLAEEVVARLDLSDLCERPEVAGPGFINLRLRPKFIVDRLLEVHLDREQHKYGSSFEHAIDRLGIAKAATSQTVVVDFSSPNVAKEMHVGHLRSTIIGDCICRLLELKGHRVIRQNHVGDWGTQFGMLCALLSRRRQALAKADADVSNTLILADMEKFYREAKELYDTDETFAEQARQAVVGLHSGSQRWMTHWRQIVRESQKHYDQIYKRLDVSLDPSDTRGESAYNSDLPAVVRDLKNQGLAKESDGAICVFPEGFKNKEGEPLPFIVQKSDGAFLYATTDLAAIRYRVGELKANRIVYVTDSRQKLHFEMLFATARAAGWAASQVELVHVTFGSVLGEDGTPLKTRSVESV